MPQASNRRGGLVAETVKATSARHGHIIHTRRAIAEAVNELARLAGNAGDGATRRWIVGAFLTAGKLHSNCYENELPEDIVLDGLMLCEELSGRLCQLFWTGGAAAS